MKDLLAITEENDITHANSYKYIAEKLMNDYRLQVKDKIYRIVECEFYYSSSNHEDPYVHGHELQKLTCGHWYFHGSGLDITLSNGDAFGGILIRGIAPVDSEKCVPERREAIIGPLNVCKEIFKQVGSVMADEPFVFGFVEISNQPDRLITKVFAVPRIGLNNSKDNDEGYYSRPYRFISFLHLPHREVEKVRKYLTEEAVERLSMEEYKKLYNVK